MLEVDVVEVVIQVDGKIRDRLQVSPDIAEDELVALARSSERVRGVSLRRGGRRRQPFVVPGKLVNFVTA